MHSLRTLWHLNWTQERYQLARQAKGRKRKPAEEGINVILLLEVHERSIFSDDEKVHREKAKAYITEEGCRIGRSSESDIQLLDSQVSREHALLQYKERRFYLSDLGSTNGTSVDGRPITRSSVTFDDRIELGRSYLEIKRVYRGF